MTPKTLARVHRVRALQLNLARADEAGRLLALADAAALRARIAGLADAVAPDLAATASTGLAAAAHYRDRLHQSAVAADGRVRMAEDRATTAAEASRVAHRDRTAVEKLIARARADAAMREMRALAEAPSGGRKRHGPC